MANTFPAPPSGFVGRTEYVARLKARLGHFNVFIYEGISGIGKTALILRLGQEAKAVGIVRGIYLPLWPGETIHSILARVEARLRKVPTVAREHQVDPYTRLWQTLEAFKCVLLIDDLQNARREDVLATVRAGRGRRAPAKIIAATRGDPDLSALDRMEIHLDRVGPLSVDEVRAYATAHKIQGEALDTLIADGLRGGSVAQPITLRYMVALYGNQLPPKALLDQQSARSVHAFKALMADAEARFADKADFKQEREALAGLSRVGQPIEKGLATKIFGPPVASLIKRNMLDVIEGDVYVHDVVAATLPGELELSSGHAKAIARHFEERGRTRYEPPLILRAAEALARAEDTQAAVDILAEGYEAVCDLGFVEAYLKTIASLQATGVLEKRLRLLSARARMRQGTPGAVREEMERLADDRDPWTRVRALAALTSIYAHADDHKNVLKAFEMLRRSSADADLLGPATMHAAISMVQLDKVLEAEKLTKSLLGKLKRDPTSEGELHRLLARIYAQSGRLEDAVTEAQAAARVFESVGDPYRAAAAHGYIGDLYREAGEFELAREAFKRFHAFAVQCGDRNQIHIAELSDAWVSLDVGDLTSASKLIAQVEANMSSANRRLQRFFDAAKAKLESGRGHHDEAARLYASVVRMWDEAGQTNIADVLRSQWVRSLIAIGQLEEADVIVQEALKRLDPSHAAPRVAMFLRESALLRLRRHDIKRAQAELAQARKLFASGGNRREEALTIYRMANAAFEEGDVQLATERADEALNLARKIKHQRAIALAQELHARLALARGDVKGAAAHSKEAMQTLRKLGDELGALHASEVHLRALVLAGDLAGAIRLGPRLSEQAEQAEIRDVRIRAIILTGVALLRRNRMDAAVRCFREVRDGQVSAATVALMYRFGEALASVLGDKASAVQRRERWVEAARQVPEQQRLPLLQSFEQLQLPPRERSHLRTGKSDTLVGTEQIAWVSPSDYELFFDVQNQRIVVGGKPIALSTPESMTLLRELAVAAPGALPMEEAHNALFGGELDRKPDKRVAPVVKALTKDLRDVHGLRINVSAKELKLIPPKSYAFIIPITMTATNLTPQQKKILRLMRRLGTVQVQALQDEFALTRTVARKELDSLMQGGLVEAVRAGRGQAFRLA